MVEKCVCDTRYFDLLPQEGRISEAFAMFLLFLLLLQARHQTLGSPWCPSSWCPPGVPLTSTLGADYSSDLSYPAVHESSLNHSSVKEPFSPGRAAAGSRPSLAPGEEWLLRISPPQNSVIGGRMHSEEEGEEALLTRL